MKIKIIIISLTVLGWMGCKKNAAQETEVAEQKVILPPEWVHNAILYEVNVRQHTVEGTFAAFEKDLPRLKQLGVTALWFMPIQPIGEKNRKAFGEKSVEDLDVADYDKYWGSYYSIKDYTDVHPRYGSKEEFKRIVDWCHNNGMKVMLDWVGNHTAWDHPWITARPDWYTKDSLGNIVDPIGEDGKSWGWTDVADLNYDNPEMRKAMIAEMKYWITEFDLDGFRCDVANEVPTDFWNEATVELQKIKPLFMLAEAETHKPDQFDSAFHAYYGWEMHHAFNKAFEGKVNATEIQRIVHVKDSINGTHVFPLNFITNHDENSWNGTIFERLGDEAWRAMAVLSYGLRGMPLLYTGQDAGLRHRLKFFEKDSVNWSAPESPMYFAFYRKLNEWKKNPALSVFSPMKFDTEYENKNFVIFTRGEQQEIQVCVNISDKSWTFEGNEVTIASGYEIEDAYNLSEDGMLGPWGYVIMKKSN